MLSKSHCLFIPNVLIDPSIGRRSMDQPVIVRTGREVIADSFLITNDKTNVPKCADRRNSGMYRKYLITKSNIPLVSSISLISFYRTGDLQISLGTTNCLQVPFLKVMMQPLQFKDIDYWETTATFYLDPTKYSKNKIDDLVKKIIQILRENGLSTADEMYLLTGLKQYYTDVELGFPGGCVEINCDCQQPKKITSKHVNTVENYQVLEHYKAINKGEINEVQRLLQLGYNANGCYKNVTLLTWAIYFGMFSNDMDVFCAIVLLLLGYHADPNQERIAGRDDADRPDPNEEIWIMLPRDTEYLPVDCLVNYCLVSWAFSKDVNFNYAREILRLLTVSKNTRSHIQVHGSDQSALATLIRESIRSIDKEHSEIEHIKFGVFGGIKDKNTPIQFITTDDGKQIIIRSAPLNQVPHRHEEIFSFFEKFYPWRKSNIKESDLKKHFYDTFIRSDIENYVDFLMIGDEFVGLNIAEISKKNIKGQPIIFHRICLALGSPALEKYTRLMSLISSQRGFILWKENPTARVMTGFEAASIASYMQVRDLDFFPMLVQDFAEIIPELYPNEEIRKKGLLFYIRDKLAYEKKLKKPSFWMEPEDIYKEVFHRIYAYLGHSLLVLFDNNSKNLAIISKSIDRCLRRTTFQHVVNTQSNDNNLNVNSGNEQRKNNQLTPKF